MILPISKIPEQESQLRKKSVELNLDIVESESFQELVDDMIDTMYDDDGIGLAAPQIGKNIRLFVVGKDAVKDFRLLKGDLPTKKDIAIINPEWQKISRKSEWEIEGCLSVPGLYGEVKRYKDIHLTGYDRFGNPFSIEAHNFFARVLQHEIDHINGILFIDKAKNIHRPKEQHLL